MAHSAEEHFKRGVEKYEQGLLEEALEEWNKAIYLDPNNGWAYIYRGLAKYDLGDKQDAILDYDQAVRIEPYYGLSYYNRGVAKSDLGDYNGAILDFDQAILLNPNFANAFGYRGNAKFYLNDYRAAILDFDQDIHLEPNKARSYIGRGFARSNLGDKQGAILDFDQCIRLEPNNAGGYVGRGVEKSSLGDKQGAIIDFDQAILIDPNDALPYCYRGGLFAIIGSIFEAQLDFKCFLSLTEKRVFFRQVRIIFQHFSTYPAPYLLHRTLSKFTDNFDHFNTLHPIVDTTRQQCRPWKRWEEWRRLSGSEKHETLAHYHALALVNHYMGDCIEAYRIYDEVLDDEKTMGVPLNLMGLYYYIESAKLFRQEYAVILEDAIEQIEETRDNLLENNALRELYYAGQILWANDQVIEAHEYFELADEYLPAAYMQLLTLPMIGADDEDLDAKIADIREGEKALTPNEGFLQGFPARPFCLEKPGEDFLAPILQYAHYREIAQAIAEVRDPSQPFEHHEMWDAFYWQPEDKKELDWLLRRERLAEINKALLEKFKANMQSGSGVHSLEHLETAFAQKLKQDLWEGTQYLGFEDFKSKSETWPDAAKEVATLIRDCRRLDANSKLLLV